MKQELKELCEKWDHSNEGFALIVSMIELVGISNRDLAIEIQVAPSTVVRWASGAVRPHPRVQKIIIKWIEDKVSTI
jgi:ribosome-binding protein aMBF1 (putative translation factor)